MGNYATDQQQLPVPDNPRPEVWQYIINNLSKLSIAPVQLMIQDMIARDKFGRQKYGVPLQTHNGRDALTDMYQEALDLTAYSCQHWLETAERRDLELHLEVLRLASKIRARIMFRDMGSKVESKG